MLPPIHAIVGYLLFAVYTRWSRDTTPTGRATLVLAFASLLPDLIDKPLYWWAGPPSGRTLAHSLLFAVPLTLLVWGIADRADERELGIAFAVGTLAHSLADALWPLLVGAYDELGFLLWPIAHSPPYEGTKPLATVAGADVTTLWFEAAIAVVGLAVWIRDGAPGAGAVRARLRRLTA